MIVSFLESYFAKVFLRLLGVCVALTVRLVAGLTVGFWLL